MRYISFNYKHNTIIYGWIKKLLKTVKVRCTSQDAYKILKCKYINIIFYY